MTTTKTTARVTASHRDGRPYEIRVSIPSADPAALASEFAKSTRPQVSAVDVVFQIDLFATEANGGVNEAGLRRYRSIVRTAQKLGLDLVAGHSSFPNTYASVADLHAALAVS